MCTVANSGLRWHTRRRRACLRHGLRGVWAGGSRIGRVWEMYPGFTEEGAVRVRRQQVGECGGGHALGGGVGLCGEEGGKKEYSGAGGGCHALGGEGDGKGGGKEVRAVQKRKKLGMLMGLVLI